MNTYRPSQSSYYMMIVLKLLVLMFGLYLSALVLSKVFTWVFAITFFVVRILVIMVASFIVLHIFLKLLFKIDLIQSGKQFIQR